MIINWILSNIYSAQKIMICTKNCAKQSWFDKVMVLWNMAVQEICMKNHYYLNLTHQTHQFRLFTVYQRLNQLKRVWFEPLNVQNGVELIKLQWFKVWWQQRNWWKNHQFYTTYVIKFIISAYKMFTNFPISLRSNDLRH